MPDRYKIVSVPRIIVKNFSETRVEFSIFLLDAEQGQSWEYVVQQSDEDGSQLGWLASKGIDPKPGATIYPVSFH